MGLEDPKELTERTLPAEFRTIEETRWLISTTFFPRLFSGQARFIRYRARPTPPMGLDLFRTLARKPRPTLYDLQLMIGEEGGMTVYPALCLRPESEGLRFIHLTDLHVALRNDLYADNLKENITASVPQKSPPPPRIRNPLRPANLRTAVSTILMKISAGSSVMPIPFRPRGSSTWCSSPAISLISSATDFRGGKTSGITTFGCSGTSSWEREGKRTGKRRIPSFRIFNRLGNDRPEKNITTERAEIAEIFLQKGHGQKNILNIP